MWLFPLYTPIIQLAIGSLVNWQGTFFEKEKPPAAYRVSYLTGTLQEVLCLGSAIGRHFQELFLKHPVVFHQFLKGHRPEAVDVHARIEHPFPGGDEGEIV